VGDARFRCGRSGPVARALRYGAIVTHRRIFFDRRIIANAV